MDAQPIEPRYRIKLELMRRKFSQSALSKAMKVTDATVSNYLRGVAEPNEKRKRQIARVLGVNYDELWGRNETIKL